MRRRSKPRHSIQLHKQLIRPPLLVMTLDPAAARKCRPGPARTGGRDGPSDDRTTERPDVRERGPRADPVRPPATPLRPGAGAGYRATSGAHTRSAKSRKFLPRIFSMRSEV